MFRVFAWLSSYVFMSKPNSTKNGGECFVPMLLKMYSSVPSCVPSEYLRNCDSAMRNAQSFAPTTAGAGAGAATVTVGHSHSTLGGGVGALATAAAAAAAAAATIPVQSHSPPAAAAAAATVEFQRFAGASAGAGTLMHSHTHRRAVPASVQLLRTRAQQRTQ
jgi:hypothetical protein